jgi:hypothetical protein
MAQAWIARAGDCDHTTNRWQGMRSMCGDLVLGCE